MNRVGIMQGRLSPSIDGRIQSFPWDSWDKEFYTAQELGFHSIEFIFDDKDKFHRNPLWTDEGSSRIKELIMRTGVQINHVCADYFMECPVFGVSEEEKRERITVLEQLIERCHALRIKGIEIPFVDNSSMKTFAHVREVVETLEKLLPMLERYAVAIGLETDLPPKKFRDMLNAINHPLIQANYDSGNSASLGYHPEEEIDLYGERIGNIHIKDRIHLGGTVPLGSGDTDFHALFRALARYDYRGDFILQAARSQNGDEIEHSRKNKNFVKNLIGQYLR